MTVRGVASVATSLVLALGLAGCTGDDSPGSAAASSTGTPNPSTTAAAGQHVVDPDSGVALTLPAGWQRVALGQGTHAQLARLLHDPSEVRSIEEQIQVGQQRGMRIIAIRPRGDGKADRMTVAITPPPAANLSGIQAHVLLSTAKFAATKPAFSTVPLPAGQSLRVHYRLTDGDDTAQYYVLAGGLAYVLTVTTSQGQLQLPTYDAVARTLRVGAA